MAIISHELWISVILGLASFLIFNFFFEVKFFEGATQFFFGIVDTLATYLGKYNTQRYVDRIKRERIVKPRENWIAKYNRLAENLIVDFHLPLTLESFTSFLCVLFSLVVIVIVFFMKSISFSVVLTVALFIGFITFLVMKSKEMKDEKVENVMDAEDIICPLARDGVLIAIKKVMETEEYIHPSLRPYFLHFIDNCENNGYSFRQAILILNKQLGPKFDQFTKKAIVFEYNERKGMADVFLDIVDENAVLREINDKKERIFRKMNRDFLLKTLVIVLFFLYALSIDEFRAFMLFHEAGKLINTVIITVICLSFARCQMLQGNFGTEGKRHDR